MAQFKVRGVDDEVVERLDEMAREAGMSRESYMRWLVNSTTETQDDSQVIRLTEPLPCGILTGSGNCGKPAHVASIWHGPVPGQWTLLPVCKADARRLAQLYSVE